jgi:hypothetical protein
MKNKISIDYEAYFYVIFSHYLQLSLSCLEILMTAILSPNSWVYIDALDIIGLIVILFLFDWYSVLVVRVCV